MNAIASAPAPTASAFPAFVRRNGVAVVYTCQLLDYLYPDGWTGGDPEVWGGAMLSWVNANKAHYTSWEGESYLRLAEEDKAVDAAIAAGKRIVVIDPQS